MSWRCILLYYVLSLGLAVYLYGQIRAVPGTGRATEPSDLPFVAAMASRIDSVVIEKQGKRLEIKRQENGRWRILSPSGVDVSSDLIEATVDTLTTSPPIEHLESDHEGLVAFGLAPPLVSVTLISGKRTVASVEMGIKNPTKTAVYVKKRNDESVFLLGLNARYYVDLLFEDIARQETVSHR
ncbi:MAG: DUF4340 domain-containing protein [Candidatus Binatia bacterium]